MMANEARPVELRTPEHLSRKASYFADLAASYVVTADAASQRERRKQTHRLDRIEVAVLELRTARGPHWQTASDAWREAVQTWWTLAMSEAGVARRESRRREGLGLLPFDDLYQEGVVGLYQAARRFDPQRGVPFRHFAGWWVRAALNRALDVSARVVRVSTQGCQDAAQARKIASHAESRGRSLSRVQLAALVGVDLERLDAALAGTQIAVSLDAPVTEDTTLGDAVLVAEGWDPDLEVDLARVRRLIGQLEDGRLRDVMERRLAGQTLEEVAEALGVSGERIRQLALLATKHVTAALRGGAR